VCSYRSKLVTSYQQTYAIMPHEQISLGSSTNDSTGESQNVSMKHNYHLKT